MPEEIAATPGWVDKRLDDVFAGLPDTPAVAAARDEYLSCLARRKSPSSPSDMLGAEFEDCRARLRRDLAGASVEPAALSGLDQALEALEAEVAEDS